METNDRTENKKSTPVTNKKIDKKNHVNQSTEEKQGGNMGVIAIIVIIAIVVLGLLFFSDLFA